MLHILKLIIATIITALVVVILTNSFFDYPKLPDFSLILLIVLSVLLTVLGIFSSIVRHSSISLGAISRAEFYGVVVLIIAAFFYLNTRVDTLFTLVSQVR